MLNLNSLDPQYLLTAEMMVPILIILATPIAAKFAGMAFFRLEKKSLRKAEITRQRMAGNLTKALIYLVGLGLLFYSIPALRALSVGLFAGVGILGIVIGIAAQDTLANLIAGISLAIFQPFRVGDRLKISGEFGEVEDINLRHTVIKTWENMRIIIPNHLISKEPVINYTITDKKILKYTDISISYDSDIDLARKIMLEEAQKHPDVLHLETAKDIPVVRVKELGESGIILRLLFWSADQPTSVKTGYELLESIKKRFDKEGLEIPFPYRTIVYKKDIKKPKTLKKSKK